MQSKVLFKNLVGVGIFVSAFAIFLGNAVAAVNSTQVASGRADKSDQLPQLESEYELLIYRLPTGASLSRKICVQAHKCEKKVKGGYSFYAFSSDSNEINNDFAILNIDGLRQYEVSANYELTRGKYFSLVFKKEGPIGGGILFEDVNLIVKPTAINSGKIDLNVFGLFKYHVLGVGQRVAPSDRAVIFKTTVSGSRNFFLMAEADAQKNEPSYIAVIKQCDEIRTPSYEVQMLEKGL